MISKVIETCPKDAIGPTLIEMAESDDKIVVLSSDVSVSANIEMFKEKYPNRFFELGIAEQSTMSVAGGLAIENYKPVYVALAIFSCGMTFPQIRQICNSNLNVKIIGTHAGVDDGQDGSGHHALEDVAITRAIPRMTVLTPSDENEVAAAIKSMMEIEGPVYMRIARANIPVIHKKDCDFPIGKVEVIYDEGDDFAIVYEGSAMVQAIEGWELLKESGKNGKLISIRTIKPLDTEYIKQLANKVSIIICAENHSVVGGLYSVVCETLASIRHKALIGSIGFNDEFTESGTPKDIKDKYGLNGEHILQVYNELV